MAAVIWEIFTNTSFLKLLSSLFGLTISELKTGLLKRETVNEKAMCISFFPAELN